MAQRGYAVKVQGEYVARSGVMGKERVIKDYEIACVIPDLEKPLSVIKNKILGKKLKKEYDDYVLFRTYHIVEIEPLSEEDKYNADLNNVSFMSRNALLNFINRNGLKVPVDLYPDLFKLREAVKFASEDPEGYEKHLDLHQEDLELEREISDLNPDIASKGRNNVVSEPSKSSGSKKGKKKKKRKPDAASIKKREEDRLSGLESEMKKDGDLGDLDDEKEEAELSDI